MIAKIASVIPLLTGVYTMIPIRHRRRQPSRIPDSPGVTDEVRDVACVVPVPAGSRKPRISGSNSARDIAKCESLAEFLRSMVLAVAAACVLAVSATFAADPGSPAQDPMAFVLA